ncbi:MAG: hypothetical protein GX580_06655 [Candidatus Hydrogenedens sp.]|nr:hypothetical protein [Candidatus Hydrogenedentota bacterium]NLF57301.1 hypothetical protein [Candidatus Hydrogenedens sp.]
MAKGHVAAFAETEVEQEQDKEQEEEKNRDDGERGICECVEIWNTKVFETPALAVMAAAAARLVR